MNKVVVIGGGAAGLMAAVTAAQHGAKVEVAEKMPAVGKKILVTGKGRCNITNDSDIREFIQNMPGNGQFLHSAFRAFSNLDMVAFLESRGLATKVERGGRIFPVSDRAADVVAVFTRLLSELGVSIRLGQAARRILVDNEHITGVEFQDGGKISADKVILAVGGSTYPGTGSSGDGFVMAGKIGHTITELRPSLIPLEVEESWITDLQGLSLKNVTATVTKGGKKLASEFGEMLFTHYGLSGPIILSLSRVAADALRIGEPVAVEINLKPALDEQMLDRRLQRDFAKFARKQMKNALDELLPNKLIDVIIDLSHIPPEKPVHQVTKVERARLSEQLRRLTFTITKTRPLAEAIVTAGGVSTKEISPSTMESKLVKGLYFAGEVIDIDGYTGGYNLQAAWSTGFVAGRHAADYS
ncbi:FAD-dependent oxidoreductase [Anaerosporomusa subterranea]|uniref:FAD-dependent oxidoreductase n=1 Tax=Anaerosporomusa subterranea TaxID=1794912 RepID=A0A154BU67_ANASB|nr:NAD(P)/FAD-dependent oxidoreductase [Anaerosporomusa subterranea]KYZ77472.1 FAD-dependent oxidoreductase [Anaerosporomusa subterranea]